MYLNSSHSWADICDLMQIHWSQGFNRLMEKKKYPHFL